MVNRIVLSRLEMMHVQAFQVHLGLLDTPQWECQQGYDAGWAAPINHTAQPMAIAANKQTLAYKIGYKAGANNGTYSACNEFSGRESHICSNAYQDGFLTIPWSHATKFNGGK